MHCRLLNKILIFFHVLYLIFPLPYPYMRLQISHAIFICYMYMCNDKNYYVLK